jgi:hypothetical protein
MRHGLLRRFIIAAFVVFSIAPFALPASGAAVARHPEDQNAPACDRACLEDFVNQYLAALAARDPSRLQLADDVKFTENTALLKVGQGTWGTINGLGTFKLYFAEPEAGQVGFIGVVKEWDNPVILCLRLKIKDGKIAEVEDFVVRDPAAAKSLDAMRWPEPLLSQAVPEGKRASREQLVRVANMYFSGLQNNDGKGVYPFADDCNRIENGTRTTNNPDIYKTPDPSQGFPIMSLGCLAQFKTGFFKVITRIRDRRFVIVDRERGLVFAFAFFDHAGTVKTITLTDGATFPATLRHPLTFEIGELFKIENGKIHFIQAVQTQEPYGITSDWDEEKPQAAKTVKASKPAVTPAATAKRAERTEKAAADCDRACLNGLVDKYRAAVIEHDPSRLPLTKDARYTENGQELKFGDGLWGTLTGWGSYKLYIDEPERGQVGFLGVTDEAGMPGLLCVRLRVVDRKVSEVEALIARKETAAGFTRPEGLTDPRIAPKIATFLRDVPESERESRDDLIAQTNLYFDGIEKSSGDIVPFAEDVIRVENGTQTCPSSFGPASKSGPMTCAQGLSSHLFTYIFPISPRRYTVVDRQRGIVYGVFMFNTPGTVKTVDVPGVGKVDETAAALRPFSEEVVEIFKLENGKITSILAVMTGLPFGDDSGWDTDVYNNAGGAPSGQQ